MGFLRTTNRDDFGRLRAAVDSVESGRPERSVDDAPSVVGPGIDCLIKVDEPVEAGEQGRRE